jgi:iron complex outermembrane receptor protein
MTQMSPRVRLLAALIASSLVPAVYAAPQTALEEVVVTARKRTEDLQTVPIAIDAFSEKSIEQLAISNIDDVAKYTPSLSYSEGLVPADTRPVLRGLALIAGRPNVAVLLDGVDLTSSSLIFNGGGSSLASQLFELERIEVVKGPQSTMFGRNAFGGAIHYISKKPTQEFSGSVSADIGEYGRRNFSGEISGPLIENKVLYRAGILNREFDGYYDNTVNGKDLGTENTSGGALALQFLVNDKLDALWTTRYTDEEYGESAIVLIDAPPRSAPTYATPIDGYKLDPEKISPDTIRLSDMGQDGLNTQTWNTNLTINWQTSIGQFTSISSLNDSWATQDIDNDYGDVAGNAFQIYSRLDQDIDTQQLSQEFRLASDADAKLRWLIGAMYFTEDITVHRYDRVAIGNPNLTRADAPYGTIDQKTQTSAVFGSLGFDLTQQMHLTLETRYSEDSIEVWGDDINAFPPVQYATIDKEMKKFYSLNPRATLDYQLNDDAMVYASISKGTKPGGINVSGYGVGDNIRYYDQEKLWNYEIGTKTSWLDDRLQVNGAIFYMDYKDQLVNALCTSGSPDCPNAPMFSPPPYLENAGKSEIKGLELDVSAVLAEGLTARVSYTYVDSVFDDYQTAGAAVTNYLPPGIDGKADISGNRQPDVSKDSLAANIRYEMSIGNGMDLFAQLDGFYNSERYWDLLERADSGEKFDANAQLGISADQWTVTLYGNNLLEDQVSSAREYFNTNGGFPLKRAYVVRLPPERQFGIRANYKF